MVTDCQVRKLMKLLNEEQTLSLASAKSGMDEKTARKYRCLGKLPSEVSKKHSWRTREDSFAEIWEEVRSKLDVNSGLQAKTLVQGSPASSSGPVSGRSAPDAPATERGVLRAAARAGRVMSIGFHEHE